MNLFPFLSISLHTNFGIGWTILVAVALLGLAVWSYRWTRPPLPTWAKLILAILRGLALLSVWFLVGELQVHWENEIPRQTDIAVMLDRSSSMGMVDQQGDRGNTVAMLLEHPVWEELLPKTEIQSYSFSSDLKQIPSFKKIPEANGSSTDLHAALSLLSRNPEGLPDAVVLLSDGAVNRGGSPTEAARKLGVPIFSVAIGDSLPPRDIVITDILPPGATYLGEESPLDVTVKGTGVKGEKTVISVIDESGAVLSVDTISFRSDWEEMTVEMKINPKSSGMRDFRVETSSVDSEVNDKNNTRHTAVYVADRRRQVLLLAGGPLEDASFAARILEDDPDTEPTVLIGGGPRGKLLRGSLPSVEELKNLDAAVVFLERRFEGRIINVLESLDRLDIPLIVFTGTNPNSRTLNMFATRIGKFSRTSLVNNVQLLPNTLHPLFTIDGDWFEDATGTPPPLNLPAISPEEGKVLVVALVNDKERPVVVELENPGKTLVFYTGEFWKWDLARRPLDPGGNGYRQLWDRMLRWATSDENVDRITVEPSRKLFTGGEEVELVARVRDQSLRPIDNAHVSAVVRNGEIEKTVEFSPHGSGRYLVRFAPWGEGQYQVDANVEIEDEGLELKSQFVVDAFNLEESELRMRPDRLRAVSQASGGKFLLPDEIGRLTEILPLKAGKETIKGSWRPFGIWSTLIIITLLLGVEWFIRTRTGMV